MNPIAADYNTFPQPKLLHPQKPKTRDCNNAQTFHNPTTQLQQLRFVLQKKKKNFGDFCVIHRRMRSIEINEYRDLNVPIRHEIDTFPLRNGALRGVSDICRVKSVHFHEFRDPPNIKREDFWCSLPLSLSLSLSRLRKIEGGCSGKM